MGYYFFVSFSIYIGNIPSNTTNSQLYNVAIGKTALNKTTSGNSNTSVGHESMGRTHLDSQMLG